jgi:hypothetical protein
MAKIFICAPLRRYSKNAEILEGNGCTVVDVLKNISRDLPELRKKLFIKENKLSAQVLIYKELKDIRLLENEMTPVDDSTELKLLVVLCGG